MLCLGIWLDQPAMQSNRAVGEYRKSKDMTVTSEANDHLISQNLCAKSRTDRGHHAGALGGNYRVLSTGQNAKLCLWLLVYRVP
jgi:hypothetical protein